MCTVPFGETEGRVIPGFEAPLKGQPGLVQLVSLNVNERP